MDMGSGSGRTSAVSIAFTAFTPARVTVLSGDTLRWDDVSRTHTVTEANSTWSSSRLASFACTNPAACFRPYMHSFCSLSVPMIDTNTLSCCRSAGCA